MLSFDTGVLATPFGYVYSMTFTDRDGGASVYVGQHRVRAGEGWARYQGSGSRLKQRKSGSGVKTLLAVAASQAELHVLEMVEIARVRVLAGSESSASCSESMLAQVVAGKEVRLLNVLDGGQHRDSRRLLELSLFGQVVSDCHFVLEVGGARFGEAVNAVAGVTGGAFGLRSAPVVHR